MENIRTTFTLPKDLHEDLRLTAFKKKVSINEIAVSRLRGSKMAKRSKKSLDREIEKSLAFFARLRKMSPQIDAAKAVREERDRDNA